MGVPQNNEQLNPETKRNDEEENKVLNPKIMQNLANFVLGGVTNAEGQPQNPSPEES